MIYSALVLLGSNNLSIVLQYSLVNSLTVPFIHNSSSSHNYGSTSPVSAYHFNALPYFRDLHNLITPSTTGTTLTTQTSKLTSSPIVFTTTAKTSKLPSSSRTRAWDWASSSTIMSMTLQIPEVTHLSPITPTVHTLIQTTPGGKQSTSTTKMSPMIGRKHMIRRFFSIRRLESLMFTGSIKGYDGEPFVLFGDKWFVFVARFLWIVCWKLRPQALQTNSWRWCCHESTTEVEQNPERNISHFSVIGQCLRHHLFILDHTQNQFCFHSFIDLARMMQEKTYWGSREISQLNRIVSWNVEL